MRLGRRIKFNMIIAILLCMVFVVNFGATLATTDYKFKSSSVNSVIDGDTPVVNHDTYTQFASMNGTSGQYVYSEGTYNNQLSVNYGFNQKYNYDLMIAFTATYKSSTHLANDFAINFVNRDDWCIDMGTISGWKIENSELVADDTQTYYTTGSDTTTLQGVMYYMGTLNGSGDLPVISSVTFHTEQKDSWKYEGDVLTITLTPYYVASNGTYDTTHKFNLTNVGFTKDANAFTNWASYMSTSGTVANSNSFMIYNSYVDDARSLAYPYDSSVIVTGDDGKPVVDTTLKQQPNYANTAYTYKVTKTTTQNESTGELSITTDRTYSAMTAGNRMYGGLGVYVIPSSTLLTVNISFSYFWQKDGQYISANIGLVEVVCSNEITTITNNNTNYNYYSAKITEPTYINVLEYIQLTAEGASDVISGDCSLIIQDVSVKPITSTSEIKTDDTDTTNTWNESGYSKQNYQIHNSTTTAPVLARVKDIVAGSATYETDISITNNNLTSLSLTEFAISSDLWYGVYTAGSGTVDQFTKTPMGDGYLDADGLIYDKTIWKCTRTINEIELEDGSVLKDDVFTFTLQDGKSIYIPSGYSLTLISGVVISNPNPSTSTGTEVGVVVETADDFWCTLTLDTNSIKSTTKEEDINYTQTSVAGMVNYTQSKTLVSGIELITEGYYGVINADNDGKIYIRNNSRQVITNVTISNVKVYSLYTKEDNTDDIDYTTFVPRDRLSGSEAEFSATQHLPISVSIKPGEIVLVCTIKSDDDAIIYDFKIEVTMEGEEESSDIDLVYNEVYKELYNDVETSAVVITNNSDNYYEFRLSSSTDLSDVLTNINDYFVERQISDAQYYYYYIGILCPSQSIKLYSTFAPNVEVQYLVHSATKSANDYVASNYPTTDDGTGWGLDETLDAEWLSAMKKLYNAPSDSDRANAEMISAPTPD